MHKGHCGSVSSGQWELLSKTHYVEHHPNTSTFARIDSALYNNEARTRNPEIVATYYKNRIGFRKIQRRVCEGAHPRIQHAKVRIGKQLLCSLLVKVWRVGNTA